MKPPDAETAEKQVYDLIREAAISAKIVELGLAPITIVMDPGPVLIPANEPKNGLEVKYSDEVKGQLAKVKVVIARDKSGSERKVKAPKQ